MAASPGGTAYPLFDFEKGHPGVVLAGKTGTAEFGTPAVNQKGGIEENYGGKSTHAWFTVFGPFDNPNIVLTVFLEGGGGGSSDAAPVAKKLLDIVEYLI
jgi:penicillin-binding protein 2